MLINSNYTNGKLSDNFYSDFSKLFSEFSRRIKENEAFRRKISKCIKIAICHEDIFREDLIEEENNKYVLHVLNENGFILLLHGHNHDSMKKNIRPSYLSFPRIYLGCLDGNRFSETKTSPTVGILDLVINSENTLNFSGLDGNFSDKNLIKDLSCLLIWNFLLLY